MCACVRVCVYTTKNFKNAQEKNCLTIRILPYELTYVTSKRTHLFRELETKLRSGGIQNELCSVEAKTDA